MLRMVLQVAARVPLPLRGRLAIALAIVHAIALVISWALPMKPEREIGNMTVRFSWY